MTDRPFSSLRKLLRSKRKKERREALRDLHQEPPSQDDDLALFLKAMKGVVPLESSRVEPVEERRPSPVPEIRRLQEADEERRARARLEELVSGKVPLPVKDTPEFVEGTNPGISPELCRHLHEGRFSIQAYLDLHGMDAVSAMDACHQFFSESLSLNRRCVAVIHGRGLSSRKEPVLKGLVLRWIRQGPFRRFVLAYASAPSWDGGAGVTYVLLSRRPVKKKRKRSARGGRRGRHGRG